MAEIDLKQTKMYIEDGYGTAGLVNHTGGYTTGATTMAVDGFTTALDIGDLFTMPGDDTMYEITAHTETTGATTSITFTPPLVVATTDNEVINVGPHSLLIVIGDGNLSYTEHLERIYKLNYGKLHHVKNGDEAPMDVNFDLVWEYLKSDTGFPITPREALTQSGGASTWVTTSSDPCEPYAVNIRIRYTPLCADQKLEDTIFEDFRHDSIDGSVKDGTLSVKGKSNRLVPTSVRVARVA